MAGRPKIKIDLVELERYASFGCTNREIAAHFGVSERTIDERRREPKFLEAMEMGVARGDLSLRQKQMLMALAGDRAMLVWLGKNRLGQRDKISSEHSGVGGAPIAVAVTTHPDLSKLSAAELDELEKLTRKALS